jgi:hypothetical protein
VALERIKANRTKAKAAKEKKEEGSNGRGSEGDSPPLTPSLDVDDDELFSSLLDGWGCSTRRIQLSHACESNGFQPLNL